MPIFEYRCESCGEGFKELIRGSGDERELRCPRCGSDRAQRKLSVIASPKSGESGPPQFGGGCGCGNPMGPCATRGMG